MNKEARVMLKSACVNTLLTLLKLISGLLGNSHALIADAIHSLSDLLTDTLAIIGSKISNKKEDKNHPFGHGKMEYITNILIAIAIIIIAINLLLQKSNITKPSKIIIIISLITIIIKYIISKYIKTKGKEYHSAILITQAKESKLDVISSIIVLISTIMSQFQNKLTILKYTDQFTSIIIESSIIILAIYIIFESISNTITRNENNKEIEHKIKKMINNHKHHHTKEIILLKYGTYYHALITININKNKKLKQIEKNINKIKKNILEEINTIKYITITLKGK